MSDVLITCQFSFGPIPKFIHKYSTYFSFFWRFYESYFYFIFHLQYISKDFHTKNFYLKTIYPNYYLEYDTKEVDSTLRIFKNRKDVDKICLMDGALPATDSEIAIDRMYADNNDLQIGDTLTLKDKAFTISGLVALSDYSALFSSASDMMFDAVKFGVAIVTDDAFDAFGTAHLHYRYSWIYDNPPKDDNAAKEQSDDFLEALSADATASMNAVTNYIPQYTNQAIQFTGDDIKGDNAGITVFLYIVVLIIAFVFAITTSNTISKEANVIGTLRASGYTKGELIRH